MSKSKNLGSDLSDLWDAELCNWRIEHRPGASPWTVLLEWTDEHDWRHDAMWVTFTWEFYGDTVHEALAGAVEWCWQLDPWRRCESCDGMGWWGLVPDRKPCDKCNQTGFANRGRFPVEVQP